MDSRKFIRAIISGKVDLSGLPPAVPQEREFVGIEESGLSSLSFTVNEVTVTYFNRYKESTKIWSIESLKKIFAKYNDIRFPIVWEVCEGLTPDFNSPTVVRSIRLMKISKRRIIESRIGQI